MAYLDDTLIGVPGGRERIQTPALVVDLDVLERNIARMAAHARANGIALRPHAKSHKSVEIATRQLAAGAVGICCAKLGEAEALAAGGVQSIALTSPVVTDAGIERVVALNARLKELIVTCDNPEIGARLANAAASSGKRLEVLVDIDPGMGRTGVPFGEGAIALVEQVSHASSLRFAGLQCYAGNLQHIESSAERKSRSLQVLRQLGGLRDALEAKGLAPRILSGGGTGTFDIDPEARVLTELQAGSYVFMDREYNDVWEKPGGHPPFDVSLTVQTTVISANHDGHATVDAGLKAFATDSGVPTVLSGESERPVYAFFGDEHGKVVYPAGSRRVRVRDVISCVVPHCDPTVNLYDCYHVVRGDVLHAIWPVEGRGKSA